MKLDVLLDRYEVTCRKMHEKMMGEDFGRGIRLLERLSVIAGEILDFGNEGRESLFRMAEGDDLLLALNAAHALYNRDPGRCAKALRAIIRKDDGFFSYAARMMLKYRRTGPGARPPRFRYKKSSLTRRPLASLLQPFI